MTKQSDQQNLEDLESILGPASMQAARLNQGLLSSIFSLDIEPDDQSPSNTEKETTPPKLQ